MTPIPFTLNVSSTDIEDLSVRLTRTRLPDQAPDVPWAYGTDLTYMRDLIPWWRDHFWRSGPPLGGRSQFQKLILAIRGIRDILSIMPSANWTRAGSPPSA